MLSVTLSPAPVLPALYLTPQLTCLSTVIFESLVISAAWFRRSTTWKEGRVRCHIQPVLPAKPVPTVLSSAAWAVSCKGRSHTLTTKPSVLLTHPLRSGHAINARSFLLCEKLRCHTPAGDTVPAATCHDCCQVLPEKETSKFPYAVLLPLGRI